MESAVKAAAKSYAASEKVPYEQLSAYDIHSRLKEVDGVATLLKTVEKEEAEGIKSSPASKKEAKLTKVFETAYKDALKSMKGGALDTPLTILKRIRGEEDDMAYQIRDYGFIQPSVTGLIEKIEGLNEITDQDKTDFESVLTEALAREYITQDEHDKALNYKDLKGGFRRRSQTARFNRCVKSIRKTVKARKGSTKESAAIGICVKSVLHKRGRTLKRYSKKRLVTQKRK
jgi:hypothetical protein